LKNCSADFRNKPVYPAAIKSLSSAAPSGALRAIFEHDSCRQQFRTNTVGFRVILGFFGGNARSDQRFNAL
jgi:hypothetical protein